MCVRAHICCVHVCPHTSVRIYTYVDAYICECVQMRVSVQYMHIVRTCLLITQHLLRVQYTVMHSVHESLSTSGLNEMAHICTCVYALDVSRVFRVTFLLSA